MVHLDRILAGIFIATISLAVLSDGRPLKLENTTTTRENADDNYAASKIPERLSGSGPGREDLLEDATKAATSDTESPVLRWALDEANRVGNDNNRRPTKRHDTGTMGKSEINRVSSSISKDFSTMLAALNRCPSVVANLPSRRGAGSGARIAINRAQPDIKFVSDDDALQKSINDILPDTDIYFNYKTCAVVGNSANLLGSRLGEAIDSHDAVFRMNGGSTDPSFTPYAGSKSTYRVLNNEWSYRLLSSAGDPSSPSQGESLVLFDSRSVPAWIALAAQTPHPNMLFLAPELGDMAREANANMTRALQASGVLAVPRQQIVPTTGWITLFMAMSICDEVNAYGFSSPVADGFPNHYSDLEDPAPSQSFQAQSFIIKLLESRQGSRVRLCLPFYSSPACKGPVGAGELSR